MNGKKPARKKLAPWARATIWVLAVLLVLGAAAALLSKPLITALADSVIRQRLAAQAQKLPDGLYAGLAGSGGPFPDAGRGQTCVAVVAGEHLYIVDAGEGSARTLALMGFPLGRADAVLLTHFHSDHISDLGELMLQHWVGGSNTQPLDVIGPAGVQGVVDGFNLAYKLDDGYRTAHHDEKTAPPSGAGGIARPFDLGAGDDASAVVIDRDGLKVTAFSVNHSPVSPAVGYRFDYKGRSVVLSGDTSPCGSVRQQARGADVLFHDAMQDTMVSMIHDRAGLSPSPSLEKITADIPSYHSTPEEAAEIASGSGVKQLVLYHISPPVPNQLLNSLFLGDAPKYFKGPITMGSDGLLICLPPGSDRIEIKKVL